MSILTKDEIDHLQSQISYEISLRKQSDEYRKEVFLAIDEIIGLSELSEYISDDIELLMFADYLGIVTEWFSKFVAKYENGELPTGVL